ncbi:MAG: glycosyltransferase family 25 protein [Planctomycetia bacterium]|nr:glycosyltransferase family 25 protein [Planctomycetia bacterium]
MLKQVFQKVFVINLDRRTDRLDRFYFDLPVDWPFPKPERFTAIDGTMEIRPRDWRSGAGAWGCYRTHLSILRHCLDNQIDSVLIMEDDAVCLPDFREKWEMFRRELPADAQMIYLGGQHIHLDRRLPRKVSEHVYQPFNVNRTHCYGLLGRPMIEKVYQHLTSVKPLNVPHHVDHFLGILHETLDSGLYVPDQWLITQSGGTSDITRRSFNTRNFENTSSILDQKVEAPSIVLVGLPGCGMNLLMKGLQLLGIAPAPYKYESPNGKQKYFCAAMAENCYDRITLKEKIPSLDRINLLRYWAAKQYSNALSKKNGTPPRFFCGFDPLYSIMIPEIMKAWNQPTIIAVDCPLEECLDIIKNDPLYQSSGNLMELLTRMEKIMTSDLKKFGSHLLPTSWYEITQRTELLIERLCFTLGHQPTGCQFEKTVELLQTFEQERK